MANDCSVWHHFLLRRQVSGVAEQSIRRFHDGGRIPGTGHVERVVFNSRGEEIRREGILRELKSRITDIQQGPDGKLYVLVDEEDGAPLILEPVL